MTADSKPEPITLVYKRVNGLDLSLDVFAPARDTIAVGPTPALPSLLYFHGGGLTVGGRTSWFPHWLYERLSAAGIVLISADYRLMPPAYGPDILADVLDAVEYVYGDINAALNAHNAGFTIDNARVGVSGTSAGGLCAYLAAAHAQPCPKVVLSLCGMAGDLFTEHLVTRKTTPFWKNYEMLDPRAEPYATYVYPRCAELAPLADSPLAFHGPDSATPGYPSNPRMQLARLYIQEGVYADYWTGMHNPSLSARVGALYTGGADAGAVHAWLQRELPAETKALLPQLLVSARWPPCILVHGADDTAVHAEESRRMHARLVQAGVEAELRVLPGEEHSFDYARGAIGRYGGPGGLYDEIVRFLEGHLRA